MSLSILCKNGMQFFISEIDKALLLKTDNQIVKSEQKSVWIKKWNNVLEHNFFVY